MSPIQLVRLSPSQRHTLDRQPISRGGGRPLERALALVVVTLAIGLPIFLVLSTSHSMLSFH